MPRATAAIIATLPLPPMFSVSADRKTGPRNNQSFEGMSFARDGRTLWVSLEGPMYQDGPAPDTGQRRRQPHHAFRPRRQGARAVRISRWSAIPAAPGKGKYADNGISEILAIGDTRLLVMERSGVQADDGKYTDYVRIYEIDTAGATDIQQTPKRCKSLPTSW
jgi:hypothetical protein